MLDGRYETDLTEAAWELIKPLLPTARYGGRPRTTDMRAVVNAIFYLLRTGCQWRLLPREFPPWARSITTFDTGRALESGCYCTAPFYEQARVAAGRAPSPSVVIMDSQSVK